MKKIVSICLILAMIISLSSCCFPHNWEEATCEEPKTCKKCGKTEGEPLGHTKGDWFTLIQPEVGVPGERQRICEVCNVVLESEELDPLPVVVDKTFAISPRLFEERLTESLTDICTVEGSNLSDGKYCIRVFSPDNNLVCRIVFTYVDNIQNCVEDVDDIGYDTIAVSLERSEISYIFAVVGRIPEVFEPAMSEADKESFVSDELLDMIVEHNSYNNMGRIPDSFDYVTRNNISYVLSVSNKISGIVETLIIQAE